MNAARKMNVISIVPRLPPAIDGVGDYAIRLAQRLRQNFNIDTHFIVTDIDWQINEMVDGFSVSQVATHTANALSALLSENPVIVNYANYAFQKWGCPKWLLQGLQQWKKGFPKAQLACMFHEVHNNSIIGVPWKHHMWAVPVQKRIAKDLARLSDVILTSNYQYLSKLPVRQSNHLSNIPILPVVSTVGEPDIVLPLHEREKSLIVFGQSRRGRAYRDSKHLLEQVCLALNIEKIIDIGSPIDIGVSKIAGASLIEMGNLSVQAVSHIFANSLVGYIDYSHDPLAKSSVFSSYCAYGLLPVSCHSTSSPLEGLHPGKNYLALDQIDKPLNLKGFNLQDVANGAYKWYWEHSIDKHAEYFYKFLM
jgi:hypothetical protein